METKIYVASLSDYNAGRLHGVWIDVDGLDVDDIQDEVNKMLAASREPVAEEWAIHDHEGLGDISESTSFERVAELAALVQEHGDAFIAYDDHIGGTATGESFTDAFFGEYDNEAAFAEDYAEQCGYVSALENNPLVHCIDWQQFWDGELRHSYFSADSGSGVYIFANV
jgi:antirestriction protein